MLGNGYWGLRMAVWGQKWMKMNENCCRTMGTRAVDRKHAISFENEFKRPKMVRNAYQQSRKGAGD